MPRATLSEGSVEFRVVGGEPGPGSLVFLHEGLGCAATWSRLPERVARATGRTAVVYSRLGYGGSEPLRVPRSADYLHEEAHRALPEFAAGLGIERPVLVGHSDGASIALLHAARYPVAGLVAMAPHVFVEPETVEGVSSAVSAFDEGRLARKLALYHDDPEGVFRSWSGVWLSPGFRDWNIEEELSDVDCPVLLVQGEHDRYGTAAQLRAIEAGIRGPVHRVEVPDCGHAPHLEHPDTTAEEVNAFVLGLEKQPGV
ncbi:alpha/beta hydrolase [Nocardiopsis exhalans]|uniref:Alpha/beta hydrolase n=1 Tax=Nocardiopsis exhalans TaxID=163604 RepID=A0ABY5DH57_9ACTN|nr:alpha/beta hydrolase [Nocardiopsis exhalans]USY22325.1 alpha/beta hydrolase [Nocardiopsis exhalans]